MATDAEFMQYVAEQISGVPAVSQRRMFGEYAVYAGAKVVALVCGNQLFVKPTAAGRALLATPAEVPPYPGAKPFFLIGEQLEDREFMTALIRATERELPLPKPKRKRIRQRR